MDFQHFNIRHFNLPTGPKDSCGAGRLFVVPIQLLYPIDFFVLTRGLLLGLMLFAKSLSKKTPGGREHQQRILCHSLA